MRVLVIGASGRNGSLIVEEALSRGHSVTALVRSATSLTPRDNLTIVTGSPLSEADITAALSLTPSDPPTAVLVALSQRRVSDSPFAAPDPSTPPRLITDSLKAAIAAMRAHSPPVRRLIVNAAQGTGSSFASLNFAFRPLFRHSNMRFTIEDHDAADEVVRAAAAAGHVDLVQFRPAMLADGEAKPVKSYGDEGKHIGFMPSITRRSVARVMVEAAEGDEWVGQSPVIAN